MLRAWAHATATTIDGAAQSGRRRARRARRALVHVLLIFCVGMVAGEPTWLVEASAEPVSSVRSGSWGDSRTWSSGTVPQPNASVTISSGHTVTVDVAATRVGGVHIDPDALLAFDPARSTTLESSANVVVHGELSMKPVDASVVHLLRFVDIDEDRFVGGGIDPVDTDIGLWVVGAGRLDLAGAPKTGWAHAAGSIAAATSRVALAEPPAGWAEGDEVSITPTESPATGEFFVDGFDQARVAGVSDRSVQLARATTHDHPQVNHRWTAEVVNLTRNVKIEGTAAGRAHVFIRSSRPQSIRYVAIRHMGPRQHKGRTDHFGPVSETITGRYGLHFHLAQDGSRGSVVEGTVLRDLGSYGYVPHASHGITFRDVVAYDVTDFGLWWDGAPDTTTPASATDDTVVDHALVAKVRTVPEYEGSHIAAFSLGRGERNVIRDSVAVGVQGTVRAAGFQWPEGSEGIWDFEDNIAHNNAQNGIFVWQVTPRIHEIVRFGGYHNGRFGVYNGAYGNNYHYADSILYGNQQGAAIMWAPGMFTEERPEPPGVTQRWDRVTFDAAGISDYAVIVAGRSIDGGSLRTVMIQNAAFLGYRKAAVKLTFDFHDFGHGAALWHVADSTWGDPDRGKDFLVTDDVHRDTVMTVSDPRHGQIQLRRRDVCDPDQDRWNACTRP